MSHLILDLILFAVVVTGILLGIKKGVISIFLSMTSLAVSAYLANIFSMPVAVFINNTFVEPKIINTVDKSINSSIGSIKDALPGFIVNNSEKLGLNLESENIISADSFVKESISPLIEETISSIAMIILFIIFAFLLSIVVKIINKLIKISFLGKINKVFGGIFGAVLGIIIVIIICLICKTTYTVSGKGLFLFDENALENSYIYNFLIDIF